MPAASGTYGYTSLQRSSTTGSLIKFDTMGITLSDNCRSSLLSASLIYYRT